MFSNCSKSGLYKYWNKFESIHPVSLFLILLYLNWMSLFLSQHSNWDKRICEKSCENWNLESWLTRCHAIVAPITVEDKCDIIPDKTWSNPTEKLGCWVITLPSYSNWLPKCSELSRILLILFAKAVQCFKYGNCSSSWFPFVLYNVT